MKLLILSAAESVHTKRWCAALVEKGIQLSLFCFDQILSKDFYNSLGVKVYSCGIKHLGQYSKSKYILSLRYLKKVISQESPDIVHAHYASSYGFLGALCGFHPFIISVWGSDVYDFPNQSWLFKRMLKYSLSKADRVLSTSHVMAKETKKYTDKLIDITPFGVDINLFKPLNVTKKDKFIVGNVKTLAPKYGIDILIRAFNVILRSNPNQKMILRIIGDGPCRKQYENLVQDLGITENVEFLGKVPNSELPSYYNSFSVSVSVSNSESFGVVAVEAMACCCPVVTSDADGFTEVVENGITGYIVPKRDVLATAEAIQKFIDDPSLKETMGNAGRMRVKKLYDWNKNVDTMVNIYHNVVN